ncbi:MAG: M50 family metallopeptidase, partial [Fimbriimonadales bacterium]
MWLTAIYLVGIFTLLVAAHEFGHMWVAKRFKMKVEEFAIGVGPMLLRLWRGRDGTLYTVRAFPVGGFVKIPGMMPDEEHIEGSFQSKPWHARFLTVLAGPVASVLFGFLLFVVIGMTAGLPSLDDPTPQVRMVMPDTPAQEAGLRTGDILRAINGEPVKSTEQAGEIIRANANKPLQLTMERDGEVFTITITPREVDAEIDGQPRKIGQI